MQLVSYGQAGCAKKETEPITIAVSVGSNRGMFTSN